MSQAKPGGIGVQNEKSLHAALKLWYARAGDQFEVRVDGFIIDLVRGEVLVEIQTRNLAAIRRKLHALLEHHPVRVIYPIAQAKWIVRLNASGKKILGRRKSPKRGRVSDLFAELVSLPDLINHENLTLVVVLIHEEEIRRADGRGSWRRQGQSIHDHHLLQVIETVTFETKRDFLRFIPTDLAQPFTNVMLAAQIGESIHTARRITYCLKKMGALEMVGKNGNQQLYAIQAELVAAHGRDSPRV